jgi:hypothetical protein
MNLYTYYICSTLKALSVLEEQSTNENILREEGRTGIGLNITWQGNSELIPFKL